MFYRECGTCNERWEIGMASTCRCPDEKPNREWVGLEDDDFNVKQVGEFDVVKFARYIEAILKERNT